MNRDELHGSLEELRAAINRGDLSDAGVKERINGLISDLEVKLERPDDTDHHESMVERLRLAFDQFKLEHPQATSLVNRILVSLGEAGI